MGSAVIFPFPFQDVLIDVIAHPLLPENLWRKTRLSTLWRPVRVDTLKYQSCFNLKSPGLICR